MCKERKLSQENGEVPEVAAKQSNGQEEVSEKKPKKYEGIKDEVYLWVDTALSSIAKFIWLLVLCGFCFTIGYSIRPSDTETYKQAYTDAVEDLVSLEEYGNDEGNQSVANEIAMFFYTNGAIDGAALSHLITEIIMDEDMPEEVYRYYIYKYYELIRKDRIHVDELNELINELEAILYSETYNPSQTENMFGIC